jgi:transposase
MGERLQARRLKSLWGACPSPPLWRFSAVRYSGLAGFAVGATPRKKSRRAFGISRKTGYKIFKRYKEHGLEALADRSRRPVRYANQLPRQIESLIVAAKRDKPHWGARKIRELLVRRLDGDIRVPAKSTIHAVLHRHGLVKIPGRPRHRATGTPLSTGAAPNDLWCADFIHCLRSEYAATIASGDCRQTQSTRAKPASSTMPPNTAA